MIGAFSRERLRCGTKHLPATYNPQCDRTWCVCGARTWEGRTPSTWHCRWIYRLREDAPPPARGVGLGAPGLPEQSELVGYDIYELRNAAWHPKETVR